MYNLLLYASKVQEDKLHNHIYNFRSSGRLDIALVLDLMHWMRAHGLSLKEEGTNGD